MAVVKPQPSLFVSQSSTNSQDFGKQDSAIKEDYVKQEKLEKNHNQDQLPVKVRCCAMLLKLTSNVQINKNNVAMTTAAMLDSDWNAYQLKRPAWVMPDFPDYEKTAFKSSDNRTVSDCEPYTEFIDGHVYTRPIVKSKVKATVKPKPKVKVDMKNNEMPRVVNDKVPCIMDFTKTYGNSKVTFHYESGGDQMSNKKKNIDESNIILTEDCRLLTPPPDILAAKGTLAKDILTEDCGNNYNKLPVKVR